MDFKYECLLMINKEKQTALYNLCDDNKSFLKILEKENIKAKGNKLVFNEIEYEYTLKTNLIEEKIERYFHFKVVCESEEKLESYIEFLKELRKTFYNHNFDIEILRDDLPLYYSEKAYILINKVENHMRKFIKYFLITKVGINWIEETTPKEIKESIKKKEDRDKEDELKRLDFIELGVFLFAKYGRKSLSELQKLIDEKKLTDITMLQEFVQQSNWEKYFKENMNCENDYLKSKWEKLYSYRNNIAHNKNFNSEDLNVVEKLYKEVNEKLKEAFDGIDKIKNTDLDKIEIKHVFNSLSLDKYKEKMYWINEITKAASLELSNKYIDELKKTNSLVKEITKATSFELNNKYIDELKKSNSLAEEFTKATLIGGNKISYFDENLNIKR